MLITQNIKICMIEFNKSIFTCEDGKKKYKFLAKDRVHASSNS